MSPPDPSTAYTLRSAQASAPHADNPAIAEMVREGVRKARDKLIDLSMRNGMLNFRHSETSARHVRIVDENLEFLVQTLASGESLHIIPLPPVEQIPRDEDTDAFRAALKAAKESDPEWLAAEDARRAAGIHDIQFELFARLRRENLLPVQPSNLDRARQILEGVTTEVTTRYEDDLAPAIGRVWKNGVAAIRADLREWLRKASEDDSGFVPRHFELSFGLAHRFERRQADPRSVADAVPLDCGIRLRGSIDLVERHPNGRLRVTDHKTGVREGSQEPVIDGGRTLQPVLYALAAEKLFAREGTVTEGRLYFCTSTGRFSEQVVALDHRARRAAAQVAAAVGEALDGPFLPAAPSEGQCEQCQYRIICGPYEEQRCARKPQENLESLSALRGWP